MPFRSKKQQRFMFATMPELAKEWAEKTDFSKLPEKIRKKRKKRKGKEKKDMNNIDICLKNAQFFEKAAAGGVLPIGGTQMSSALMQQEAAQILSMMNQTGAPSIQDEDVKYMYNRPFIREALQRIIDEESIDDIRTDALGLTAIGNYTNWLNENGLRGRLVKLLQQAP